jgi:hypothetical protein
LSNAAASPALGLKKPSNCVPRPPSDGVPRWAGKAASSSKPKGLGDLDDGQGIDDCAGDAALHHGIAFRGEGPGPPRFPRLLFGLIESFCFRGHSPAPSAMLVRDAGLGARGPARAGGRAPGSRAVSRAVA